MAGVRPLRYWILTLAVGLVPLSASAGQTRYAGPGALGNGDGLSAENTAAYTHAAFWQTVQSDLQKGPVTVSLAPGDYVRGPLTLSELGHPDHPLTIDAAREGQTVFRANHREKEKPRTGFYLKKCRNVTVRGLTFTGKGPMGYITQVSSSRDISFESCRWIDLPNMRYGATGSSRKDTRNITFKRCVFKRVGLHGGAHMIYNAYGPRHIYVIDSTFEDCAGAYVRFRAGTDFCVVSGCTFLSTGTWPPDKPVHRPFIEIPLFNDVNPGDEVFGTHFLIRRNIFRCEEASNELAKSTVISFLHRGYDPPDLHHLMTPTQGAILQDGTTVERKELLKRNCGIDTKQIIVFENTYRNVGIRATFGSSPAYGAKTKGWVGTVPIFDLFEPTPTPPAWYKPPP